MGPVVGRIAFTVGVFLVILALIPLPFLEWGSPEFVVDVLALLMSGSFLTYITVRIYREARLDGPDEQDRREP